MKGNRAQSGKQLYPFRANNRVGREENSNMDIALRETESSSIRKIVTDAKFFPQMESHAFPLSVNLLFRRDEIIRLSANSPLMKGIKLSGERDRTTLFPEGKAFAFLTVTRLSIILWT